MRVRKGNILIGDNRTLNNIFRESRFNGWTQGELFIVTDDLIPNARRDDFEQNEAYYKFIEKLQDGVGCQMTKAIREASQLRNDSSAKIINEIEKQVKYSFELNAHNTTLLEQIKMKSLSRKHCVNILVLLQRRWLYCRRTESSLISNWQTVHLLDKDHSAVKK